MCGFVGGYDRAGAAADPSRLDRSHLERMLDTIRHRGPDGEETWRGDGLAFGHVRLAILDLTDHARQPMVAPDARTALVFNGEIYNFPDLRAELEREGATFGSTGDTEVLFEALCRWGPAATVERLNGMFAFAFFDGAALWFARDRLGIKPLYVTERDGTLYFASEIKALLAHPDVPTRPDFRWMPSLLMQGRLSGTRTPFEGVEAVEAGALWRVTASRVEKRRYFDATRDVDPERILRAARDDPEAAVDRFEAALRRSVRMHMVSDVPLATMCSGGVDSSLITAFARDAARDLRAYVADVGGSASEGAQARRVGRHLDVPVVVVAHDRERHLRLLPHATWHLDAPNFFPSDTALLEVARRAHGDGIKVLLTGEGADELFSGYPQQTRSWAIWRRIGNRSARRFWRRKDWRRNEEKNRLAPLFTDIARHHPALRWRLMTALDPEDLLRSRRVMKHIELIEPAADRALIAASISDCYRHLSSLLQRHDRMGMAASIEMRVPFLENDTMDLGLHAPRRWRFHDGKRKWIVKRAAERHLPSEVIHAPKKGFPTPSSFHDRTLHLLEGGALADLLGWGRSTTEELLALSNVDAGATQRLVAMEVWARVFFRREDPDEIGERLVAASRA